MLALISSGARAGRAPCSERELTWTDYKELVRPTIAPFEGLFALRHYDYIHPVALQAHWPAQHRKVWPIHVGYTAWGDPAKPVLICLGGITNNARRWDYLARALSRRFHVVCLDWLGRGRSGWLPDQNDYVMATYVEQVRQLVQHLGRERVNVLGSSMGGSVALALNAASPGRIDRLVLNDVGPYIPVERRGRRAQAVARHYVFRQPSDLFRRMGAAAKNDGPISDEELLHHTYCQTQWSEADRGRVYRHDPRALSAYATDARESLDQWDAWKHVRSPVMLVHGMLSDALLPPTIERMRKKPGLVVMHVPETGHTPSLSDPIHLRWIEAWLSGEALPADFVARNTPVPPRRYFTAAPQLT